MNWTSREEEKEAEEKEEGEVEGDEEGKKNREDLFVLMFLKKPSGRIQTHSL
jgi:hypothetical protein